MGNCLYCLKVALGGGVSVCSGHALMVKAAARLNAPGKHFVIAKDTFGCLVSHDSFGRLYAFDGHNWLRLL